MLTFKDCYDNDVSL